MPQSSGVLKPTSNLRVVRQPLRVGVILAEHFTLSAFAVFIDHLRLAADEGDRSRPLHVQWSIMSSRQDSVPASCGVMIEPTSRFLPPESLDYVIVIGGLLHAGPQIDEATTRYLREVAETRVPLIGICTGSFISLPRRPDARATLVRELVSLSGFPGSLSGPRCGGGSIVSGRRPAHHLRRRRRRRSSRHPPDRAPSGLGGGAKKPVRCCCLISRAWAAMRSRIHRSRRP